MKFLVVLSGFFLATQLGYSGQTVRVGVLDTGLDLNDVRFSAHICPGTGKDFTRKGLEDHLGHGTHVAGLIEQYAKDKNYCLVIAKYTDQQETSSERDVIEAFHYLEKQHLDILNFSGGGYNYDSEEYESIKRMKTVKIFAAAGNDGKNIDHTPYYPASYDLDNIQSVAALDMFNSPASFSNYSAYSIWELGVNVLSTLPYSISQNGQGYMSGTSMSTAVATGKYIYANY